MMVKKFNEETKTDAERLAAISKLIGKNLLLAMLAKTTEIGNEDTNRRNYPESGSCWCFSLFVAKEKKLKIN